MTVASRILAVILLACVLEWGIYVEAFSSTTRTWVSGVGDDVNPCSRTAPCKTWAGALVNTGPGGAITALDPGSFAFSSALEINQSLSIDGGGFPAAYLPSNSDAFVVKVAPNETVVLSNLQIIGGGTGKAAITLISGNLFLDNVDISGVETGILIRPASLEDQTRLFVSNTRIQSSSIAGIEIGTEGDGKSNIQVALEGVTIQQGAAYGVVQHTGYLTLSNSVVGQNGANGVIFADGSAAELNLLKSQILNNQGVGLQVGTGAPVVRLVDSQLLGNAVDITCATGLAAHSGNLLSQGDDDHLPSSCTTSSSEALALRTSLWITILSCF